MIDMTKYGNSSYLKAADLTAPRTRVKIHGVTEEPIGSPPRNWLVLIFTTKKLNPLILKPTKLRAIVAGFGLDETTWIGKVIDLVKVKTTYNGGLVDSISIEIPPQPEPPPAVAAGGTGPSPVDNVDLT